MKTCPTCGAELERIPPTPASKRVLDYVVTLFDRHGLYPSVAQIRTALGFRTSQNIGYHLRQLAECGWVELVRKRGGTTIKTAQRAA